MDFRKLCDASNPTFDQRVEADAVTLLPDFELWRTLGARQLSLSFAGWSVQGRAPQPFMRSMALLAVGYSDFQVLMRQGHISGASYVGLTNTAVAVASLMAEARAPMPPTMPRKVSLD